MADAARARNVVVGVTGGIAAYKACEVVRGLMKRGHDVRVVATANALEFVGEITFRALTGHDVTSDLFADASPIAHIDLASWADAIVVVPATANVLAKMAAGIADDALTSTLLAAQSPVIVAPAMNTHMWNNAATQENLATLRSRGVHVVEPAEGLLACGDTGAGKLAEVDVIVDAVVRLVEDGHSQALVGRRVVITAGPTREYIDPVRFLGNASSGKMGMALARAVLDAGAQVTLVLGPCEAIPPAGAKVVRVTSANQMRDAALEAFEDAHMAICCAAVADYMPVARAEHKLKKGVDELDHIDLVRTPDILAELSECAGDRVVVGFAAETDDLVPNARKKLASKGCDMIVANDVSRADSTFGSDTNRVTIVTVGGERELPVMPKDEVAREVVAAAAELLGGN